MRRILQFGVSVLLLSVVLTPLLEYFDRWDAPGLGSDTEFALFAVILLICLLLAVCKILKDRSQNHDVEVLPAHFAERPPAQQMTARRIVLPVVPSISPPLRI